MIHGLRPCKSSPPSVFPPFVCFVCFVVSGLGLGSILQQRSVAGVAGQIAMNIVGGKKNECVQPWKTNLAHGGLGLEQGRRRLRLTNREQRGVVVRAHLAVLRAGPGARVAPDATAPCFALNEPEALLGQNKQIDLVI
jgi:hypothetical protein